MGPALGMICAPFVIVPNPTTPSATTCPHDDDAVAAVPPQKFPPSSRLRFDWGVARWDRHVVLYPFPPPMIPETPGTSSHGRNFDH